jgi:hypothetical protein
MRIFIILFLLVLYSCHIDNPPYNVASDCTNKDIAGTWRLENQSTWNEITCNETGSVIAASHPHGVSSVSGQITLTKSCSAHGWYRIIDEECLDNIPPQPRGTWTMMLDGCMLRGKSEMALDYVLEYTQQNGQAETYTGTWYGEKRD